MASYFYVVIAFMQIFITVHLVLVFTDLFRLPVSIVSIACVLWCCLCVKSALFVMFGLVLMDLTRNLSLCGLCVAVKLAKLKQIHSCFVTSES